MITQYQMVRHGNIHKSDIIQTVKIILMCLGLCNNILVKNRDHEFERAKEELWGRGWREEGEAGLPSNPL